MDFSLYPTPTNGYVTIDYRLEKDSEIIISLHDINGTLIQLIQPTITNIRGHHQLEFHASHLNNGVYFVVISTPEERADSWYGVCGAGTQVETGGYLLRVLPSPCLLKTINNINPYKILSCWLWAGLTG